MQNVRHERDDQLILALGRLTERASVHIALFECNRYAFLGTEDLCRRRRVR